MQSNLQMNKTPKNVESRPVTYIPDFLRQDLPTQGCMLRLTLRSGRVIPGVCVDSKGFIYGVLVSTTVDANDNPINFAEEEIDKVELIKEIPEGYQIV